MQPKDLSDVWWFQLPDSGSKDAEDIPNLPRTLEESNAFGGGCLPSLPGFEVVPVEPGKSQTRMKIRQDLLAPDGFPHAASIIALADPACGYGTVTLLPANATGFTAIELKSNFRGTCRAGNVLTEARCIHACRTSQVGDASVPNESNGKKIAVFLPHARKPVQSLAATSK